jgi:uncharacterized phage protein gp47/JayE
MALATKTFARLVQDWAAAAQSAAATLLDFTTGSILRAVAEAQSGIALWLQALILRVLATSRLATSTGADVDSFVADFGLTRLPAVAATGIATFARFTPTNQAIVPVGALLQTLDGSQTFAVYADPAVTAFSALLDGYVIAANVASLDVPVRAVTAGSASNISAGTLTVLQTGISGVDTITNAAPFVGGVDAESDAALQARFIAFINSLSKGTTGAFAYAITALQQGLQHAFKENEDYAGTPDNGLVTVVVDDGSGAISGALVTLVQNVLETVRAAGVRVVTFAATILTANVTMTITTASGYDHAVVAGQVDDAVTAYINGLGLANTLAYTRLAQVAYDTSPGVTNVGSLTLNSGTADLVPTYRQTVKVGTVVVT